MPETHPPHVDLETLPGHYVRRIHQLAVALFAQELAEINITPVQYSALQTICNTPGIDQGTLAKTIGFDTSTLGSVIDRMEVRGLVDRRVSPQDRRVRLITPTEEGCALLAQAVPPMLRSQELFLDPLTEREKSEFMRLMTKLARAGQVVNPVSSPGGRSRA